VGKGEVRFNYSFGPRRFLSGRVGVAPGSVPQAVIGCFDDILALVWWVFLSGVIRLDLVFGP
jgi:hypothetical protein